jgi:hypothetical protein
MRCNASDITLVINVSAPGGKPLASIFETEEAEHCSQGPGWPYGTQNYCGRLARAFKRDGEHRDGAQGVPAIVWVLLVTRAEGRWRLIAHTIDRRVRSGCPEHSTPQLSASACSHPPSVPHG